MTDQSITTPNARTYSLEDIVGEVLAGRVRIPEFQRAFRWQWEDVRRLVESIVRGYPIGSLLLWSRAAKETHIKIGALAIDAPNLSDALWVVDGQQRLTSLASALNDAGTKDGRFAMAYDLKNQTFVKPTEEIFHTVPLPILFDLQRLLKWFAEHPESAQYLDEGARVAKAIRQYSIPAYIVKQEDENVLRDIFDRMNNYGKRLTRAEVFSALHAGRGQAGPPRTLADIIEHVNSDRGFGVLDEDTILRVVLARRGADVTREIRVEFDRNRASEFPNETPEQAYRGGEEALSRSIEFLQEDAGVPHFAFLTYRYLLVVLARFFAHHPQPSHRNRVLLRRWFWRAALVGPEVFSGSTPALRTFAARVAPEDETRSVQSLLEGLAAFTLRWPGPGKFRSTSANSRVFLCALWNLRPRSVLTGEVYDRSLLAGSLEEQKTAADIAVPIIRGERNRASNRVILLGDDSPEDARARFANPPLGMAPVVWTKVLDSHALTPTMTADLASGRGESFLDAREARLTNVVRTFLAAMTEVDFEDTPPLETFDLDADSDEMENRDDASE